MIEREGNLFSTTVGAIGHGVNVDGVMGAGIAVHFKTYWPEMYLQYRALCASGNLKPGSAFVYVTPNFLVYNIASQDRPGPNARLDWLEEGLTAALSHANGLGHELLALPRIGCGIGGLDWQDVRPMILDLELSIGTETEVWTL